MNLKAPLPSLAVAAAAIATLLIVPVSGQNVKESFTGFAINLNAGPRTTTLDFTIERWSTDAERNQLLSIITENKNPTDQLLRTLQRMPSVGHIRTPETLAWDLRYAHQSKLDEGGRRIVLATDRPMGFREVANQTRTVDYPFTIIEIRLNDNDEGEGKILAGTKIFVDKNKNVVLENYGQQPVRFNQIRKQR